MNEQLPTPCENCFSEGGYWVSRSRNGQVEMVRCKCARGLALSAMDNPKRREPRSPIITTEQSEVCVEMLAGAVDFFPSTAPARGLIAAELRDISESVEQAIIFIRRFGRIYRKWPGIGEMRWAFCQMGFLPLDAIEPVGSSDYYPDGLANLLGARQPNRAVIGSAHSESRLITAK